MTEAWSCANGAAEVFIFDSGMEVDLQAGFGDVDAARMWARLQAEGKGTAAEVLGLPVHVADHSDEGGRPSASAILGDSLVEVLGPQSSDPSATVKVLESVIRDWREVNGSSSS